LLISVKGGVPEGSILNHGISSAAVTGLLILTVVSVLVATVSIALADIGGAAGYPVLQHTQSKRPVAFEHYRDPCRFHLFLRLRDTFYCPQANQTNGVLLLLLFSHVWSTGQDQVLSIKKELLLIVPTLKIWLDVENLSNIDGLEDDITNSDMTRKTRIA